MIKKFKFILRVIAHSFFIFILKDNVRKRKYIYIKELYLLKILNLTKYFLNKFRFNYEITIDKEGTIILNENDVKISINNENLQLLHRYNPDNLFYSDILINNLKFFQKRNKIDIQSIVDLGANIGTMSINLAKEFQNVKIVCVEGSKNNFEILKKNLKIQNFNCENIYIENRIIGPKNRTVFFSSGLGEKSQIISEEIKNFKSLSTSQKIEVSENIIELEEIIKRYDIKSLDFLKVDIEGAEIYLFDSIINIKPKLIVMEYNYQKMDLNIQINFYKKLLNLEYEFFEEKSLNKIENLDEFFSNIKKTDIWIARKIGN